MPADRRKIAEDPHAEYDNDSERQVAANSDLVTEVNEERRESDVREKRHEEDSLAKHALEAGSKSTKDGVERGHDRHRQVLDQRNRYLRSDGQSQYRTDEQRHEG